MKTQDLVCGVVSPDLLQRVTKHDNIKVTMKDTFESTEVPGKQVVRCTVRDNEIYQTFFMLTLSPVAPAKRSYTLGGIEHAKEGDPGMTSPITGDLGEGYVAAYDDNGGAFRNGAHLDVLRNGWLYDVYVYNWKDGTPEERRKLAEDIVLDIEKNLDTGTNTTSAPARTSVDGALSDRLSNRLG